MPVAEAPRPQHAKQPRPSNLSRGDPSAAGRARAISRQNRSPVTPDRFGSAGRRHMKTSPARVRSNSLSTARSAAVRWFRPSTIRAWAVRPPTSPRTLASSSSSSSPRTSSGRSRSMKAWPQRQSALRFGDQRRVLRSVVDNRPDETIIGAEHGVRCVQVVMCLVLRR